MAGKSFDRFRFRSEQGCFMHSQPSFSPAGLSFVCARLAVYHSAV